MTKVPFFPNTKDGTHCYQACLRSIFAYFEPEIKWSWGQLDQLSAKKKGLWTWPMQGLINIRNRGYDVIHQSSFDYPEFIHIGGDYLIQKYGEEVAQQQILNSDIHDEQKIAREYITYSIHKRSVPSLDTIKSLLNSGYLMICNVNYYGLYNQLGYGGHFIVVYKVSNSHLTLHDPGLPARPELVISTEQFGNAWEYPNSDSRNLQAIKKNNL